MRPKTPTVRVPRGPKPREVCAHCGQRRHPSFRRHCGSHTCTWWECRCGWTNGATAAVRGGL